MSDDREVTLHKRLLEHYLDVCRERLDLWVPRRTEASLEQPCSVRVTCDDRVVRLSFQPQSCLWIFAFEGEALEGNFDKVTKKLRQVLTSL